MLVAEHNRPVNVRDGDQIKTVMAGLSVLRIGDDGKLEFVRKYDIDIGDKDDVVDGNGAAASEIGKDIVLQEPPTSSAVANSPLRAVISTKFMITSFSGSADDFALA